MRPVCVSSSRSPRRRRTAIASRSPGDPGAISLAEVLFGAGPIRLTPAPGPTDLAVLQYTGGTTGVSKGAMLSHRALRREHAAVPFVSQTCAMGRDVAMAVMPFFHVYGLTVVMGSRSRGAAAMILEPQARSQAGAQGRPTLQGPKLFSRRPAHLTTDLNSPLAQKYDLRSIEPGSQVRPPLLVETHREFVELTGAESLVEGIGLTDAAPVTHCNPLFRRGQAKVGSIGIPYPDVESKIVDVENRLARDAA